MVSCIFVFTKIAKSYLEKALILAFSCEECKESKQPYFHKYEVLLRFKEKGKKRRECEKSGLNVEIATLLEGILDTKK
jgi:hypothetical protein